MIPAGEVRRGSGALRSRRVRASALALALLCLGLSACFIQSQHDPFASAIVIVIENAGGSTADITVLRDGGTERLGRIPPGEVREFRVVYRGRPFTLRANLAAGRVTARGVNGRPGESFRYRIESDRMFRIG